MKSILALGPFIGDFEQEMITFRPYVRWLCDVIDFDEVYLSTHFNRTFLYDFIPAENIVHVFENLSRDELNQRGYVHATLKQKDFNILIKKFVSHIIEKEECNKKDINLYNLSYVKSTPPYSIFKKIFEKIQVPQDIKISSKNRIVFIPDKKEEDIGKLEYILDYLEDYDVVVIGDMNSALSKKNIIFQNIDYFENGWKYIIKYISEARAVICPTSYWTAICNLQGVPVFSWGPSVGQYKRDGIYFFNNKKSIMFPSVKDTNPESITGMIEYFLKGIQDET